MSYTNRASWQFFILSALVQGACMVGASQRAGALDDYALRSLDSREYFAIAQNLAAHGRFSQGAEAPRTPDTWRTPGYPFFLASVITLLGDSPTRLVVAQQVLSVLNAWLLFVLARSWMSHRLAWAAATLFLLEPYRLYYSFWLLPTTWMVTTLLLLWLVWQRVLESGRWPWAALGGTCSGLLVLIWPGAVLIPVMLFSGLLWLAVHPAAAPFKWCRRSARFAGVAAFAVGCVVVVGSWMMRNRLVAGHFALSSQSGVVLAYFKATEVSLWRHGRTAERYLETSLDPSRLHRPHTVWDGIDARLQSRFSSLSSEERSALTWPNLAQGNKSPVEPFAVSNALRAIAWAEFAEAPLSTVSYCFLRSVDLLTFPHSLVFFPPRGVEVVFLRSTLLGVLYAVFLVALVVRLVRGGFRFGQMFFPLASTLALLLVTTPQTDPRFRVPMMAMLSIVVFLPASTHTPQTRT